MELEEARTAGADGKSRVIAEIVEGMGLEGKIGRVKERERVADPRKSFSEKASSERVCGCRGRVPEERPQRGIMRTVRIEQTSLDGTQGRVGGA